ncbi:MAG: hypothetical protein PF508_02570 [Spirochaeta sp.]|jgi:hypothetical protein|nr:hypothetical protein [Spirochaeta sp.]
MRTIRPNKTTTGKGAGVTRLWGTLAARLLAVSGAIVFLQAVAATGWVPELPDTAPARRSTVEAIQAPVDRAYSPVRRMIEVPGAEPVLYRTDQQNGNRYHIFIPAGSEEMQLASAGTFIVRRRLDDGAFDQIKIFLQRNEGSYIRLFPHGRTARMDVYVAHEALYRSVPVAMTMERALTASTDMLIRLSSGYVDWSFLDVDTDHAGYATIERMAQQIRDALPGLPDAEDGAMDADGNLVFIESLVSQERLPGFNCSGFAKWVVDGIFRERTGRFLEIDPLKEKHLDYRGTSWSKPLEDLRDPYFGLDWTRNLAREVAALNRGVDRSVIDPEALDVRNVPSAQYTEDVGYRVDTLTSVLYRLARRDPGTFYLGSVNRLFGEDPVLRQHTHVVALFPYFDRAGTFHVAVMERNVETSVASLERRYGNDFIHLVRVPGSDDFTPPRFGTPAVD